MRLEISRNAAVHDPSEVRCIGSRRIVPDPGPDVLLYAVLAKAEVVS